MSDPRESWPWWADLIRVIVAAVAGWMGGGGFGS